MEVKVRIKTSQYLENGEVQTIESFYRGEQIEKNGSIYITFLEYDTIKDSKTTIKISDEEVLILKSGEVKTRMKFKEGVKFRSTYSTPYGNFDMSIYTYKISKKITNKEIKVNLDYKIKISGLMDANNRIELRVIPEV